MQFTHCTIRNGKLKSFRWNSNSLSTHISNSSNLHFLKSCTIIALPDISFVALADARFHRLHKHAMPQKTSSRDVSSSARCKLWRRASPPSQRKPPTHENSVPSAFLSNRLTLTHLVLLSFSAPHFFQLFRTILPRFYVPNSAVQSFRLAAMTHTAAECYRLPSYLQIAAYNAIWGKNHRNFFSRSSKCPDIFRCKWRKRDDWVAGLLFGSLDLPQEIWKTS